MIFTRYCFFNIDFYLTWFFSCLTASFFLILFSWFMMLQAWQRRMSYVHPSFNTRQPNPIQMIQMNRWITLTALWPNHPPHSHSLIPWHPSRRRTDCWSNLFSFVHAGVDYRVMFECYVRMVHYGINVTIKKPLRFHLLNLRSSRKPRTPTLTILGNGIHSCIRSLILRIYICQQSWFYRHRSIAKSWPTYRTMTSFSVQSIHTVVKL